jgi:hypothetical protein
LLQGQVWDPPLTIGSSFQSLLWLGASFATISLVPKVADMIKAAISGKPFAYGTAIGEAFGPAIFAGRGALQYGTQEVEGGRLASFEEAHPGQKYPGWWLANFLRRTKIIG